uniref:ferredoxin thioreductase subunit beta n=1 Tax=Haramonas pauciplastida TaxID=478668 RepID=UPI002113BDE8|nr:ferredoxin thioreductase subunit beta [Haramonas pauciplastida]UTE94913.1 ferredoxin thioreductase subunit beta [Haramonas pauciplastida]
MLYKTLNLVRQFAEKYAKQTNTYFCSDLSITASVLEGLALNKNDLGTPLCPCRYYSNELTEAKSHYWNCPCLPMRERKECHCMLFLVEDKEFSSNMQELPLFELTTILFGQKSNYFFYD